MGPLDLLFVLPSFAATSHQTINVRRFLHSTRLELGESRAPEEEEYAFELCRSPCFTLLPRWALRHPYWEVLDRFGCEGDSYRPGDGRGDKLSGPAEDKEAFKRHEKKSTRDKTVKSDDHLFAAANLPSP